MKLIKTDGYWIIVSDEIIKNGEIGFDGFSFEFFRARWMEKDWRKVIASNNPKHNVKEVGLPSITFSDEVAKELGIIDVEKLASNSINKRGYTSNEYCDGVEDGYNQALSDNKDKLFTLEQLETAIINFATDCENNEDLICYDGEINGIKQYNEAKKWIINYIQSLTKQQFDCELEMKIIDKTKKWSAFSNPLINIVKNPKITKNSVKVIKLIK